MCGIGFETYLATAHCLVWGCLMCRVLLELEQRLPSSCSRWALWLASATCSGAAPSWLSVKVSEGPKILFGTGLCTYGTAGTAEVGTLATMMMVIRLLVMVVLQGINLAGWDVVFLMFNFLLRLFTVGITGWLVTVGIMACIN